MKSFFILIISLSFSLGACQQSTIMETTKVEYVIYGKYCGECLKNCARMYKLNSNKLLIDTTDDYFKNSTSLVFNDKPLSKEQYLKAKKIMDSIPEIISNSNDSTFGKPDNRDQCGIFLQIKTSGKLKTFHIDTDSSALPKELRHYAAILIKNSNLK